MNETNGMNGFKTIQQATVVTGFVGSVMSIGLCVFELIMAIKTRKLNKKLEKINEEAFNSIVKTCDDVEQGVYDRIDRMTSEVKVGLGIEKPKEKPEDENVEGAA